MQYQKNSLVQEQKLKLSPQLLQSIQLMALPIQELRQTIQQELETNPALEMDSEPSELSLNELDSPGEEYDFFENSSDPGYTDHQPEGDKHAKQQFLEGALARNETLQDHLLWQLHLQSLNSAEVQTGETIIRDLDSSGFRQTPLEQLLSPEDQTRVNRVLPLIQALDPQGCAVSDYRESLLVQIRLNPAIPDQAALLIDPYGPLIEKKKYRETARKMEISEEELQELLAALRHLNPYPGTEFSKEKPAYVIPDLMIYIKEGDYLVYLNKDEIPVLRINPEFLSYENSSRTGEVEHFAHRQISSARTFMKSIRMRNETLLKVARSLVDRQREFFQHGPKHLAPLTLRDIADEIGVSESTVSRISNSKYVQTEWGIFPIKYFFSSALGAHTATGGSQGFSKESVKEHIREIISQATTEKHLSDQKIADILAKKGIPIARRTVAKYRKELKIDSSFDR